jgi:hypothetical protein
MYTVGPSINVSPYRGTADASNSDSGSSIIFDRPSRLGSADLAWPVLGREDGDEPQRGGRGIGWFRNVVAVLIRSGLLSFVGLGRWDGGLACVALGSARICRM